MESINETPSKKRRLDPEAYDSQDDSGDDIFNTFETVATVPLPERLNTQPVTAQSQLWTQPTQIDSRVPIHAGDSNRRPISFVQIAASSPLRGPSAASPSATPKKSTTSSIGSLLAPAGTSFRPPNGAARESLNPQPAVICISDDDDEEEEEDGGGPMYCGDSSDENTQFKRADIKPSSFVAHAHPTKDVKRFKDTITNSVYKQPHLNLSPGRPTPLLSSDIPTTAYGGGRSKGASSNNRADPATTLSAKAVEPTPDIALTDIQDYQMRDKIKSIRKILPFKSILECRDALLMRRNNYADALEHLADSEGKEADAMLANVRQPSYESLPSSGQRRPAAKQQIKAPIQKIHERWTATQHTKKSSQVDEMLSIKTAHQQGSRRRLVQGHKRHLPNSPSTIPHEAHSAPSESEEADSGLGEDSNGDDSNLAANLLGFFNTCAFSDVMDIAATSEQTAKLLLSRRPFSSLDAVRQTSITEDVGQSSRVRRSKATGNKIVDKCLEMWEAYDAVDELVRKCQELSQPLKDAMCKWGIDIHSSMNENGELELVDISCAKDSGIGTPTSRGVSAEDDNEGSQKIGFSRACKEVFLDQPSNMGKGIRLKDYQVVGMNWLSLLYHRGVSCILADDMGLGKTCQVIAFLAHLLQKGIKGPHLIIVPGSTLENWLREFSVFCPELNVVPYYAGQKERLEIRAQIEDDKETNVVITTYTLAKAKDDNRFLRKLKPNCCIYDEGHMLRNSKAAGYEAYMRIDSKFRLLLTGTPLQNNLRELVSLLGFILPSLFREQKEYLEAIFNHKAKTTDENDESHAALLSTQRIKRAKSMMGPFVLRRKKHQVLKDLPAKFRRVEYCDMSQSQLDLYESERKKVRSIFAAQSGAEGTGKPNSKESTNILMQLRKAAIHPMLFRRLYDDQVLTNMAKACLKENEFHDRDVNLIFEDMTVMDDVELHLFCNQYPDNLAKFALRDDSWMDSGKVKVLGDLLRKFKSNGDRTLVFSQFVLVMNILELVMETLEVKFFRLDGQTKMEERQLMIDEFHRDPRTDVFLLSTKAGGAGINLACANKVIIFDSSFNPQDDVQAENRAHRVGQTQDVEVIRLITKGSIEEKIYKLGETKLALDDRLSDQVSIQEVEAEAILSELTS